VRFGVPPSVPPSVSGVLSMSMSTNPVSSNSGNSVRVIGKLKINLREVDAWL
jgi:hypothetical protein